MSARLREHGPGEVSWIVARQAALYWREYGWGAPFEALLCEIGGKFLREFRPGRERCFVAESDGRILGAVFVVERSAGEAQLRMLYVEPQARGAGIGRMLVRACIDFARGAGYASIVLWTNDPLHAARHLYEEAGFTLLASERNLEFGEGLVAQTWRLELAPR